MKISGGTTLGNCAIGSPDKVTKPTMTMMIEITMATMGRLMKNFDMRLVLFLCGHRFGGHLNGCVCRIYQRSLAHLLDALKHHTLARLQTLLDDPQAAHAIAHSHRLNVDLAVCVHDRDLIAALQFRHGALRHQNGVA